MASYMIQPCLYGFLCEACLYQIQKSIKSLRSDNGGEYISKDFKRFCEDHGISRQFTIPYTPQQNGVAERKNRTLMKVARSMLMASNLDAKF